MVESERPGRTTREELKELPIANLFRRLLKSAIGNRQLAMSQ